MTIFTADVSSWDGPVDWPTASRAGITAAFIKATEGGGPRYRYRNPLFDQQHDGAVDAGLPLVGAYHCLSGDDVNQQIEYYQQALAGRKTALTTVQGYMLDVEPFDELRTAGALPSWSTLAAFCLRWADASDGAPLGLYLPHWVWQQWGSPDLTQLHGQILLISSNYPAGDTSGQPASLYARVGGDSGPGWVPYGGRQPHLWQFSSSCSIPGIRGGHGGADINAFRLAGGINTLTTLFTSAGPQPVPAPHPQGDPMLTNWSSVARGSIDEWSVRTAQGLLLAHGYPVGSRDGLPDGSFGPITESSTRSLQTHYGITVDGIFGPHTLSVALYKRDLA